jgi:hypothetical protein
LLAAAAKQSPDDPLTHHLLAELYRRTHRGELAQQEESLFQKLTAATGNSSAEN